MRQKPSLHKESHIDRAYGHELLLSARIVKDSSSFAAICFPRLRVIVTGNNRFCTKFMRFYSAFGVTGFSQLHEPASLLVVPRGAPRNAQMVVPSVYWLRKVTIFSIQNCKFCNQNHGNGWNSYKIGLKGGGGCHGTCGTTLGCGTGVPLLKH